jgi:hypothetical protein
MQKYGLLIADNGSDWYFQGDSNDGWNNNAPDKQDTYIGEILTDSSAMAQSEAQRAWRAPRWL